MIGARARSSICVERILYARQAGTIRRWKSGAEVKVSPSMKAYLTGAPSGPMLHWLPREHPTTLRSAALKRVGRTTPLSSTNSSSLYANSPSVLKQLQFSFLGFLLLWLPCPSEGSLHKPNTRNPEGIYELGTPGWHSYETGHPRGGSGCMRPRHDWEQSSKPKIAGRKAVIGQLEYTLRV